MLAFTLQEISKFLIPARMHLVGVHKFLVT